MRKVTVAVPPTIRQYTRGESRVLVEARTVREALGALSTGSEELRRHLFDSRDQINRFVRIFVDGRPAPLGSRGDEAVEDGAEVTIVLALAGG
jgi:molybdopterin synthase sulfur carrier subunit